MLHSEQERLYVEISHFQTNLTWIDHVLPVKCLHKFIFFNIFQTPGRLHKADDGELEGSLCQEYVIFDVNQARPLYLLEYTAVCT